MHYSGKKFQYSLIIILLVTLSCLVLIKKEDSENVPPADLQKPDLASPTPSIITIPNSKTLKTDYHIFQTFNNCGPAALSMALHFYGVDVSQEELGLALRPYQVANGDNDDKSVTLDELANKAKDYGFIPFHRPMGNPQLIKRFITNGIPVITRTWTKPNEDIGHFHVVKGYDDDSQTFLQDDSLQGKKSNLLLL